MIRYALLAWIVSAAGLKPPWWVVMLFTVGVIFEAAIMGWKFCKENKS
jgi:hypothetical protein